jgi:hypothetical protein
MVTTKSMKKLVPELCERSVRPFVEHEAELSLQAGAGWWLTIGFYRRFGGLPQFALAQSGGSGSNLARSNSTPARPYMARFSVLSRFICPSVWPLLRGSLIAFELYWNLSDAVIRWRSVLAC